MSTSLSDRYTGVAIALHWVTAALVVAQIAWGWWMQEIPKQPVGPRVDAFNLHKSLGLTLLALTLVRLGWRLAHPPPPLPPLPAWQALTAKVTHFLLYALLIVQPLAGYLGSVWSGYPVRFYGTTLPAWGAKDAALKELCSVVHLWGGVALTALIALHVAGALAHALIHRNGIVARMGLGRPRAAHPS
jgi:cytochrome b561